MSGATGLVAVAGGLAQMFAVCGIGAILIGQATAIFSLLRVFSPGDWMQKLGAKIVSRPVDMGERINAPFHWPPPVVDVVSDPSHVLNHNSWSHSRPPSLY
jgi:hypothetical protein